MSYIRLLLRTYKSDLQEHLQHLVDEMINWLPKCDAKLENLPTCYSNSQTYSNCHILADSITESS